MKIRQHATPVSTGGVKRRFRELPNVEANGLWPTPLLKMGGGQPNPAEVRLARDWLITHCRHTTRITRRHSSYGWKHQCEQDYADSGMPVHISHGAMIAALLAEGHEWRRTHPESPAIYADVTLISPRQLKRG